MAAVDDDRWEDLPMDLLTEILLRLPPISGRRLVRLVCSRGRPATARVFDDLAGGGLGGSREIWNGGESRSSPDIVGTCNGLLCLMQRGGEITLVNPVTGESLAIPPPPPPPPPRCRSHTAAAPEAERLSFSYHPLTGRYSIVHFPAAFCYGGGDNLADPAVEVLTLDGTGAASWREVAAPPGSRCCLPSRIVSVDGATYWVTKVDARIMSLDHEHERVTPVPPLPPAIAGELDSWWITRLTEVAGRLGVAITSNHKTTASKYNNVEVWVLDGARGKMIWSHRYTIQGLQYDQEIAWPHFAYGENVLTILDSGHLRNQLYTHWLWPHKNRTSVATGDVITGTLVEEFVIDPENVKMFSVINPEINVKMFSYVETNEPLNIYKEVTFIYMSLNIIGQYICFVAHTLIYNRVLII
uniref:F-box domain-containing protein n=1 Tax=Oryza barthii TaxID=65489 RepID=A0A0D3HUN5_9ORYZ